MVKKNCFNLDYILFIFIPISIILGPTISLLNIILFSFYYIYQNLKIEEFKSLIKNKTILLLILLNLYLILHTFVSLDSSISIFRNFGFIRFIIFFIAINFFFYQNNYNIYVLKPWLIIFSIFIFDVFFERFYGTNILGYGAIDTSHGSRIVSFFKDEPIAGAYINGFLFLILGYISLVLKKRGDFYKYFSLLFFVLFLISVLVTGERSNTIKAILGF